MKLDNKVVIITGASSGIGEALTYELSKQNTKIVIVARNIDKLHQIAGEISSTNILTLKADVSCEADCKMIVEKTIECFGTLDVLINNAGISMRAVFEDLDLNVIRKVMDVNFWGTVYCTKYALPYLLKSKGSVVGVSSIAGYKGLPGRTGYSASKFAMHGFLEALRIENLKKDLHVMIVSPGYTKSNIRNTALAKDGSMQGESPLEERKLMSAEEVAHRIVKGIEFKKHRLVMTSQGKMVVLFNKFFPKMLDKMVYNTISKEPDSPFS